MKVSLKNKTIIDNKTKADEFLGILLKNRQLDESFLKTGKSQDLAISEFGIDKKNFEKTIELIKKSININEKIVIYGDYDVDGVTATAILWRAIYPLNKNVFPFVPDREDDGYGINYESFEKFCNNKKIKADVLITVDNGVVAQEVIEKIKKNKTKVIVIDHHQKNDKKILVDGLIHSTKTSASVLAYLTARNISKPDIDLAATGLIADCANMSVWANRIVAIDGLKKLRNNANMGLDSLLKIAKVEKSNINEETIGYVIGPRINATGRMSSATKALRLLCFDNKQKSLELAKETNKDNYNRQLTQREAISQIANKDYKEKIIIESGKFHPGIIGLLASKLSEKNNRPAIVISTIEEIYKGSARSVRGFDITAFLRTDKDLFESLGGHSGAAGFSITKENFKKWIKKANLTMKKINIEIEGQIKAEAKMRLSAVNLANLKIIEKLRPFGEKNDKPLFLFEKLRVIEARTVGSDQKHLKLKFDDTKTPEIERVGTGAIAFGKGFFKETIDKNEMVNVLAYLNLNEWMGKKSVELLVKEIWV